jgi:hypothetical protein
MGNDSAPDIRNEGQQAYLYSAELVQLIDRVFNDSDASWDDYRKVADYFMDEDDTLEALNLINNTEDLGIMPRQAAKVVNWIRDAYHVAKQQRGSFGPKNLSNIGTLVGSLKHEQRLPAYRYASDFFIQYMKAGTDAIVLGERGTGGKTNFMCQYLALPWMTAKFRPVVTGISIANNKDYPLWHTSAYKSDMLIFACEHMIESRNAGKQYAPPVMMINDEASATVAKKRAMGDAVVNAEALGYVARHFGVQAVWAYIQERGVPGSILEFATHTFKKPRKKLVISHIRTPYGPERVLVGSLKGRDELRMDCRPFIDYSDEPETSEYDINSVELLFQINALKDKYAGSFSTKFYEAALEILRAHRDERNRLLTELQKPMTPDDLMVAWSLLKVFHDAHPPKTPFRMYVPDMLELLPPELEGKVTKHKLYDRLTTVQKVVAKDPAAWTQYVRLDNEAKKKLDRAVKEMKDDVVEL